MSFPRYPKYKPSGVEWLGDVPEHWEAWKLTHALEKIGSGTTPKTDNRAYYDEGTHPWVNTGDLNDGDLIDCEKRITSLALSDHTTLRTYPVGSVVIAMYGATIGKLAILGFEATVNQACCVFAGESKLESKFLFYWLLGFRQQIISLASGGGQPNVNQDILRTLRIACPDLPEQTAIAEFLDRETGKIDGLVAEQRRLMELLKEKRQAVISHAVTKGLNPHAPMKPSGIEWLGDVPVDWTLKRLQNVCHFQSGKAHEPFICDDGIYMCVTSRFVSTEGMKCKMCSENISPARKNDTLMVMSDLPNGRALAKAYFVGDERAYAVNQRVCILRPISVAPKYLYYLLDRSPEFLQHDDGINQTHLSNSEFLKPQFPFPPYDEQVVIASYLDTELAQFDTLTAEAQRAIDLLQERRTALISAAVTGQIDLRQQPRN